MKKRSNSSYIAGLFAIMILLGSFVLPHLIVLISHLLSEYLIKLLGYIESISWLFMPEYYILCGYRIFPHLSYVLLGIAYMMYAFYTILLWIISYIGYLVYSYGLLVFVGMISFAAVAAFTVTRQMIERDLENMKDN